MLKTWMMAVAMYLVLPNLIPSSQVVMRQPKGDSHHPTHATCEKGISHLTTARAGSVSLCFKNDKAQTDRHLAPGCEDELSGLDPANKAAFSLNEGHTETKGYSGGIGLCLLTVKHTIKLPTGSVTFPELQSTNCVKKPRRTASHARSSRRLEVGIATSMGGLDDE